MKPAIFLAIAVSLFAYFPVFIEVLYAPHAEDSMYMRNMTMHTMEVRMFDPLHNRALVDWGTFSYSRLRSCFGYAGDVFFGYQDYHGMPFNHNSLKRYRPLSSLSFSFFSFLGYPFVGRNFVRLAKVASVRGANAVLHALSAPAVMLATERVLGRDDTANAPLCAALAFALTPAHVMAVHDASNRHHLLAFFTTLALATLDLSNPQTLLVSLASLLVSEVTLAAIPAILLTYFAVRLVSHGETIPQAKDQALRRLQLVLLPTVPYLYGRFYYLNGFSIALPYVETHPWRLLLAQKPTLVSVKTSFLSHSSLVGVYALKAAGLSFPFDDFGYHWTAPRAQPVETVQDKRLLSTACMLASGAAWVCLRRRKQSNPNSRGRGSKGGGSKGTVFVPDFMLPTTTVLASLGWFLTLLPVFLNVPACWTTVKDSYAYPASFAFSLLFGRGAAWWIAQAAGKGEEPASVVVSVESALGGALGGAREAVRRRTGRWLGKKRGGGTQGGTQQGKGGKGGKGGEGGGKQEKRIWAVLAFLGVKFVLVYWAVSTAGSKPSLYAHVVDK